MALFVVHLTGEPEVMGSIPGQERQLSVTCEST